MHSLTEANERTSTLWPEVVSPDSDIFSVFDSAAMAEIFGVVTGALSVAALFSQCVECFEYIQLGRHFGQDYEEYRLKLSIAENRLGRWGEAVDINGPAYTSSSIGDHRTQLVHSILEQLRTTFEQAYRTARRYESRAPREELALCDGGEMRPVYQRWNERLRDIARRRQKETSLVKKASWALYDRQSLLNMLENIRELIVELEKLDLPLRTPLHRLAQQEVEWDKDRDSLAEFRSVAAAMDEILAEAASDRVAVLSGHNWAQSVVVEDRGRVRVGSQMSGDFGGVISDRTANATSSVVARDDGRVHVGNSYGGKGIFDD